MLVGELIVTDGMIAYVSNRFKQRYVVDLTLAWKSFRERKSLVWLLVLMMSVSCTYAILAAPKGFCITSPFDDEENWARTACPRIPGNITEMTRVSPQYYEEWAKYN